MISLIKPEDFQSKKERGSSFQEWQKSLWRDPREPELVLGLSPPWPTREMVPIPLRTPHLARYALFFLLFFRVKEGGAVWEDACCSLVRLPHYPLPSWLLSLVLRMRPDVMVDSQVVLFCCLFVQIRLNRGEMWRKQKASEGKNFL